jgi:hypothetical protein
MAGALCRFEPFKMNWRGETIQSELDAACWKASAQPKRAASTRAGPIEVSKVAALKAQGLGATEIAKRLGVGRASVYRVLADA